MKHNLPILFFAISYFSFFITSSAQQCPTSTNWTRIATSGSGYTMLNSNSNSISYDSETELMIYIHQQNHISGGGNSGVFKISSSKDKGNSWTMNMGPLYGNSSNLASGRHPMAAIYNPAGNTIPDSAFVVFLGSMLNVIPNQYTGAVGGVYQLGSGYSTEYKMDLTSTNYPGAFGGLCQGKRGTFFAAELENQTNSLSTGGLQLIRGDWVDSFRNVVWKKDTLLIPDYDSTVLNRQYAAGFDMAFDPTGRFGWIVLLTHVKGSKESVYSPLFWTSDDSGATWKGPITVPVNQYFKSGSGLEMTCGLEVDLTVDAQGNPHALVDVLESQSGVPFGFNPGFKTHFMTEFLRQNNQWRTQIIDSLNSFRSMFTNGQLWFHDTRPQMSRSLNGQYLVYSWFDSDTLNNVRPRLKGKAFDLVKGCWTQVYDFSKCSGFAGDSLHLSQASPLTFISGSDLCLTSTVLLMNSSGQISDSSEVKFIQGAKFPLGGFTQGQFGVSSNLGKFKLCKSANLVLTAFPAGQSYKWSNGDTTASTIIGTSGWASVSITSGCMTYKDSVFVENTDLKVSIGAQRKRLCPSDSIQLSYQGNGKILWSNGDTLPTIYVSQAGWVKLNVSDDCGDGVDSLEILSPASQMLSIIRGSLTGCPGDSVELFAGSNHTNYVWSNGQTSASIVVSAPGNYYCTIEDSTGCFIRTDTLIVQRVNFPNKAMGASNAGICSGDSTQLYIIKYNGPYLYQWYKNGTAISGAIDTAIWTSDTGTYSIQIKDTSLGCQIEFTSVMNAYQAPTANISVFGNTTLCKNDSVLLVVNGNAGGSFIWMKDGAPIQGAKDSMYFAKSTGMYSVKVTAPTGCYKTSSGISVVTDASPSDSVKLNKPVACEGDTILMQLQYNSAWIYQWYDISGPISGADSSVYGVTQSGDYYAIITTAVGCITQSQMMQLAFQQVPYAQLVNPNITDICKGDSVMLEAVPQAGVTYQWRKNGKEIAGAVDSIYWVKEQGDFDVVMTNGQGCPGISNLVPISDKGSPDPKIQSNGGYALCPGDTLILDVQSKGTYSTIEWFKDGSPWGNGGQAQQVWEAGTFTVKVNNTNGCVGTSSPVKVISVPTPVPVITRNGNILTSTKAFTYQWFLNGAAMPGANNQSFTMVQPGNYAVEVSDTNGCTGRSAILGVNLNLHGPEANQWLIFPNPVKENLYIQFASGLLGLGTLSVYDITGKLLIQKSLIQMDGKLESLPVSLLNPGIYFLTIQPENGKQTTYKFIKE